MKNIALILASGIGARCELGFPKQFALINGKSILEYTVQKFENNAKIDEIYLVTSAEFLEKVKNIAKNFKKVKKVIQGRQTRKDSSYNGITAIDDTEANVLIHDGVRPLVSDEIINECIDQLDTKQAVCTAIDSTDTIFFINENNVIKSIPNRKFLKRAQTPQAFKLSLIRKAHELADKDDNCQVTDDCGLINYFNLADIYLINGDENNIKITYKEDIEFVKKMFTS